MTEFPELWTDLAAEFHPNNVRTRTQAGRQLSYITARTAMNRLDDVLGPENWWDHYVPGENSVICVLTIRLPDGSTVSKQDAGGYAGMADQGDDDKSGFSDAFKRAAVKFGVGRYLYKDGVPTFRRLTRANAPEVLGLPAPPEDPPAAEEWDPVDQAELRKWIQDLREDEGIDVGPRLNAWVDRQGMPRRVKWTAGDYRAAMAQARTIRDELRAVKADQESVA